jgi:hypothetical protein
MDMSMARSSVTVKMRGWKRNWSKCVAAELAAQREVEQAAKERERQELAEQIAAEEEKVKELGAWVRDWKDALSTREFINALEKVWRQDGHDLSPETERGQRILLDETTS